MLLAALRCSSRRCLRGARNAYCCTGWRSEYAVVLGLEPSSRVVPAGYSNSCWSLSWRHCCPVRFIPFHSTRDGVTRPIHPIPTPPVRQVSVQFQSYPIPPSPFLLIPSHLIPSHFNPSHSTQSPSHCEVHSIRVPSPLLTPSHSSHSFLS